MEVRPDIAATAWNDRLRDALPPSSDDVCIARDGRKLDSAAKIRAFIEELNAQQAD